MHLIGWISLGCLVVFFLELWSVLSFGPFFLSPQACYVKGRSLRCSPGRGNTGRCAVMLYMGEGSRGSNGACSILCSFSVTSPDMHNQIGPFWCCFPSGWVCVHSRTLWVSLRNFPVRLGVSPAATSTPTGVFIQWFEALFPHAGTLGCTVCHLVHQLLPCRPAAALPTLLHNLPPYWVLQPLPCWESSLPGCPSPPLLPVWMNVSSLSPWLSDFHTLQFSVSSGDFFCFYIVVVLLLVVWGCTVCLPMPPSWPKVLWLLNLIKWL